MAGKTFKSALLLALATALGKIVYDAGKRILDKVFGKNEERSK